MLSDRLIWPPFWHESFLWNLTWWCVGPSLESEAEGWLQFVIRGTTQWVCPIIFIKLKLNLKTNFDNDSSYNSILLKTWKVVTFIAPNTTYLLQEFFFSWLPLCKHQYMYSSLHFLGILKDPHNMIHTKTYRIVYFN